MPTHPFAGTPQFEQQYGEGGIGWDGNGLGEVRGHGPDGGWHYEDDEASLPHGWSIWDAGTILSGYDRPLDVCENEWEVLLAFTDHLRPTVSCAYCDDKIQTRSPDKAVVWFREHVCSTQYATTETLRLAA